MLRSDAISLPHGFSTRQDDPDPAPPGFAKVVRLKQVHSADVVAVEEGYDFARQLDADALVTNLPGVSLVIVTADCAPVLLADAEAGVVAACHAGWRGANGGIIANTVQRMADFGASPQRTTAIIGPTIAQSSYEVDEAFRANFEAGYARFFVEGRDGHWQFDLPGYVAQRLRGAGVGTIDDLALDTYADADRFHSYRRATHRNTTTGGRQTSWIGLPS